MIKTQPRPTLVRRARSGDADEVRRFTAFLRGLSLTTGTRRFFSPVTGIGESRAADLLGNGPDRGAWLATDDGTGGVVGHACWVATERRVAELALVVDDAWQGQGIGRRLVAAALQDARGREVEQLELVVQADNYRVLASARRAWPTMTGSVDAGLFVGRVALTDGRPAAVDLAMAPVPARAGTLAGRAG